MNENEIGRLAHAINEPEHWLPIPGYERTYAVSSLGRVYSHPRPTTSGGMLKASVDDYGYPRVGLVQDGRQTTRRVHVLVMLAFRGPAPEGLEVRHLDGDKLNPRLENLAYGTKQENALDTVEHGQNWLANKTHCPRNHPYDDANTLVSGGRRYCRACALLRREASR